MSDEKKIILGMLSEGKIDVSQAEKLLDKTAGVETESSFPKSVNRKFLKILINEENNTKVNINIPLALAEVGLKLVPKDMLKIKGEDIDIDEILKLIEEKHEGELVNIETIDKDKEMKVKIFIE